MAITTITHIENGYSDTVVLVDVENTSAYGSGESIAPGMQLDVNINVPWAASAGDFPQHHLELQIGGQTRFWIWQAIWADGDQSDYVRFSQDGVWQNPGAPVFGVPAVEGPRTLVVQEDGCFQLLSFPAALIAEIEKVGGLTYGLCPTQPTDPNTPAPRASVPKLSAVAFSMAGIPSDAFKQGVPGARFLYQDSGKRYEFRVVNGVVHAYGPDGTDTPLTNAVSYTRKRAGEWTQQGQITLPPLDLIAANGGRVFAKAQGQDAFYFTTMDSMFIGADDQGREFVVPSTYFKLDPEFNQPGAQLADLLAPFRGCFADHPAAARFPLFRLLMELNLIDMMMVRLDPPHLLDPPVWHLIDVRPPMGGLIMPEILNAFWLQILAPVQGILGVLQNTVPWLSFLNQLSSQLATWQAQLQQDEANLPATLAPPSWDPPLPTYQYVSYCVGGQTTTLTTVRYTKVLDIGVGHVHWHEQYESITGGELQPMRAGALFPNLLPQVNYAYLYRFFNGPVSDGDGYIDGTCNFYALVQLKDDTTISNDPLYHPLPPPGSTTNTYAIGAGVPDSYAILYIDEQSYFTQRWRVVHPDDYNGLQTALVKDLHDDLTRQNRLYKNWRRETYWCPFHDGGLIGSRSRMAVSRQVLLVNGEDQSGNAVLYSINFSYDTMDLTWRWRTLSNAARAAYFDDDTAAGAEVIPPTGGDCVYPQTVRLREDMTIHLKGRRQWGTNPPKVGRWYQRYLPATNVLIPSYDDLVANSPPPASRPRQWRFLPETVLQAADKFSHFGVYDIVNSRTQYYAVTPATDTDAATLSAIGPGPWVDMAGKLYVRAWKFWMAAPLRPPDWGGPDLTGTQDSLGNYEGRPERHPSIFNPDTLLRIEQRNGQWIALHWDKRDDDIMPFDGLPMQVVLQNWDVHRGATQVTVTLQAQQASNWIEEPPVVPLATFIWTSTPGASVALDLTSSTFPPIWRVHMAALDASRPGGIVRLLDVEMQGNFTLKNGGVSEYSWTPTPEQAADLQRYCSSEAVAEQYGTSIWCEDIVGHVSVPEEVHWPLDTTPPTLQLPSTITTDATSPQGAVVNYTVTATDPDNTTDQITIACTPASGSTFPIGTTTVQCRALDPTGNSNSGIFQVVVKGASAQVNDLISLVNSFHLSNSLQTSLDNKLQDVLTAINAGQTATACSELTDFIGHVQSQTGKGLTTTQASQLLAAAKQVQAVLAC